MGRWPPSAWHPSIYDDERRPSIYSDEYENAVSLRDFAREPYHTKQAKDVKRRFRLRAYVRAVGLLCMIARDSAHRVFCPGGVGAQYAANDFKAVMHPRKVLC